VKSPTISRPSEHSLSELDDSPIGCVGVGVDQEYNEEKNIKAAWILDIGVLKIHQRGGVGTRLVLGDMRLIDTKDMADAMLGVDDQNPMHAIGLYEKVGFRATRKDVAYHRQIRLCFFLPLTLPSDIVLNPLSGLIVWHLHRRMLESIS